MPNIPTMYAKLNRPTAIINQGEINLLLKDFDRRIGELENAMERLSIHREELDRDIKKTIPKLGVSTGIEQRTVRKRSRKKSGSD